MMQVQRVVPVMQSVAQMRNWVVANVPLANTLLGYDLFLKIGNDFVAGLPLDLDTIAAGMPYPADEVAAALRHMADAGLVQLAPDEGASAVQPTERFLSLLDTYSQLFERLFIVRSRLRGNQFRHAVSDPALAAFAQLAYDRVFDLGWLYLHNFGSVCFLMASLVRRIAIEHGYDARVASCHVEIGAPQLVFALGARGQALPGQIDGHAVVVIDDRAVLDFGLGSVRKNYRRDFPWGVAFDYRRDGAAFGAMAVGKNERAMWKDDWQSPGGAAELTRYAPLVDELFEQYRQHFLER